MSTRRVEVSNAWAQIQSWFVTFHSGFVRGDGGTLDRYAVFLCGQGGIDGDLVVSLIAVWQTQVKVFQLHINIGQDELRAAKPSILTY